MQLKGNKPAFFPAIKKYGACRWVGNIILPHGDLLKFEIGLSEAERIKCSNVD